MLYEFEITDADIGKTIGPPSGFLVGLSKVRSQTARTYITPDWNEGEQRWQSAYLQLRATGDVRDLVCINPAQATLYPDYIVNKSIAFYGDFVVKCVPHQTSWRLTLSDTPLTQREISERVEAIRRKALEDHVVAVQRTRGAKSTARTADALLEAAQQR